MGLLLSRKKGESFQLGEAVVKVVEIRGSRVRLDVSAPPEVPVRRSELDEWKPGGLTTDQAKKDGAPF